MELPTYLDAAATTPVHPEVLEAMLPYFTQHFGNANSQHVYGELAKNVIDDAKNRIAHLVHVEPQEILLTSGATEAINIALQGAFLRNRGRGRHIITSKVEHKAVLNTISFLETIGAEVSFVELDRYGRVNPDCLKSLITDDTTIVALMHVNNETGTINDIESIAHICSEHNIVFFCDATQAIGHIPVNYSNNNLSLIALSAHKFCGPVGVGALIKKDHVALDPILFGGGNQSVLRPGTQPTPLIAGFGKMCEILMRDLHEHLSRLRKKSIEIETMLVNDYQLQIPIPRDIRSPHIIPAIASRCNAVTFLQQQSQSFVASTGSACNYGLYDSSYVAEQTTCIENPERFIRFSISMH